MLRWSNTRILLVVGFCLYLILLIVGIDALGHQSFVNKPTSPSTFNIAEENGVMKLTLHSSSNKPAPESGVLLPVGPDDGGLPGLPGAWKEIFASRELGKVPDKKTGFDALQAISKVELLLSEALYNLPLCYPIDEVFRYSSYAYLLSSKGEFIVLDLSKPATPQIVCTIHYNYWIRSAVMRNGLFFLLLRPIKGSHAELLVVDLRNPLKPKEIRRQALPDEVFRLTLCEQQMIAVAPQNEGQMETLHVYDLTEDHRLVYRGACENIEVGYDFVPYGSFWLIAESSYGLRILDMSDPFVPQVTARLDIPEGLRYLTVAGDRLFAWGVLGRHYTIDITDPFAPKVLWVEEGATLPAQLLFVGRYTYFIGPNGGLTVFDCRCAAQHATWPEPPGGTFRGSLYVNADRTAFLRLGGSSRPIPPLLQSQVTDMGLDDIGPVNAAEWWDKGLLVLANNRTLCLLDGFGPAPRVLSKLDLPEDCCWLTSYEEHVFLGGGSTLLVVTMKNDRLTMSAQLGLPAQQTYAGDILVAELLIAGGTDGMLSYALDDPDEPSALTTLRLPRQLDAIADFRGLAIEGNRLFAASGPAGLITWTVAQDGRLSLSGGQQFPSAAKALCVNAGIVLVATDENVQVVDVRGREHLQTLGSIALSGVEKLVATQSGYWAGTVPGKGWTVLPMPAIFELDEGTVHNTSQYILPVMPAVADYRIQLFNTSGTVSLPGTYKLAQMPITEHEQGGSLVR